MADRWDRFKDFVYRSMPEGWRSELELAGSTYRIDKAMEESARRTEYVVSGPNNADQGWQPSPAQQESLAQFRRDNDWDGHERRMGTHIEPADKVERAAQHVREYLTERGYNAGDLSGAQLDEYLARTNPKLYDEVREANGQPPRAPSWGQEYEQSTGMQESRTQEIVRRYGEAIRKPGELDAPPPPVKPTQSVDYIETERFHSKHAPPPPVQPRNHDDGRQQGLGLER